MFDIARFTSAASADEAVRLLRDDPAAMLISGGTDALIRAREGKLRDRHLVSIHALPELTGVRRTPDDVLIIGAATPFAVLAEDPILRAHAPILCEACTQVGGPQTRQAGTIGGNLANGAVSADSVPALLCLNATLVLQRAGSTRTVPVTAFHTGPGHTVCARDELLREIRIAPEDYTGFSGCYLKYGKRAAMEIATLGCAALLRLAPDGKHIASLRLALGVAAPTPIRCRAAEQAACGAETTAVSLRAIAATALEPARPRDSWRASAAFRTHLIPEMALRAMTTALARAGGV